MVHLSEMNAVTFGEKLELKCTMYRSSSGKYQEKDSKIAVSLTCDLGDL